MYSPAPQIRRSGGSRQLVATLAAIGARPHLLEVVSACPVDGLGGSWLVDPGTTVTRRLSEAVRDVAVRNGGRSFRLDHRLYAVLAPRGLAAGHVAMALRSAAAAASPALADCVVHGSVQLPDEAGGPDALALALARLRARARWSSRSAERQVRDVLLRLLTERRTGASPRVTELAVAVGRRMGLGMDDLDVLVRASELQDVGKLLIPDAILRKATPLTPEEWETVRCHPIVAEEILNAAPALAPVARLLRFSQERHDATGYPDGLGGDAIPLAARIISVCIAFDAMTAERPYRERLPVGNAVAELCRCAGRQFDPAVVAAFCSIVDNPRGAPAGELLQVA